MNAHIYAYCPHCQRLQYLRYKCESCALYYCTLTCQELNETIHNLICSGKNLSYPVKITMCDALLQPKCITQSEQQSKKRKHIDSINPTPQKRLLIIKPDESYLRVPLRSQLLDVSSLNKSSSIDLTSSSESISSNTTDASFNSSLSESHSSNTPNASLNSSLSSPSLNTSIDSFSPKSHSVDLSKSTPKSNLNGPIEANESTNSILRNCVGFRETTQAKSKTTTRKERTNKYIELPKVFPPCRFNPEILVESTTFKQTFICSGCGLVGLQAKICVKCKFGWFCTDECVSNEYHRHIPMCGKQKISMIELFKIHQRLCTSIFPEGTLNQHLFFKISSLNLSRTNAVVLTCDQSNSSFTVKNVHIRLCNCRELKAYLSNWKSVLQYYTTDDKFAGTWETLPINVVILNQGTPVHEYFYKLKM